MNKRILELAEQAHEYAESEYDKLVSTPNFSEFPNTRKIFDEKFAELIIMECAGWVNDNVGLIDEKAKADLLKHFGVK